MYRKVPWKSSKWVTYIKVGRLKSSRCTVTFFLNPTIRRVPDSANTNPSCEVHSECELMNIAEVLILGKEMSFLVPTLPVSLKRASQRNWSKKCDRWHPFASWNYRPLDGRPSWFDATLLMQWHIFHTSACTLHPQILTQTHIRLLPQPACVSTFWMESFWGLQVVALWCSEAFLVREVQAVIISHLFANWTGWLSALWYHQGRLY